MPIARLLVILPFLLALGACDMPRDPEGTLDKVRGKELIVGVMNVSGLDDRETAAIERVAQRLEAEAVLQPGEPHKLVADLNTGHVHLLAGGIPKNTPFKSETGLTAPVSSTVIEGERVETVFAVRKGENGFLAAVERALRSQP
ncbi:hypothetical protein ACKTEK_10240 [Tepidamorphus sp. 3E244]|uniref:hypothetical protein n=1 Tax=Tepidamorphus sp. 3E244 TaxID=3385498 RepID=UPI0038FC7B42